LVIFDNHGYSVPVEYGFNKLTLYAYTWRIEIACGDRVIAAHRRRYGKEPDAMAIEHYLPLLARRPGAFPYAKPVRQWEMPRVYREFYEMLCRKHNGDGVREFIQVLLMGRQVGSEMLEWAMSQALVENRADSERIRQLITITDAGGGSQGVSRNYLEQSRVVLPDLGQFDRLRAAVAAEGGE
jgi:hypothetical protein